MADPAAKSGPTGGPSDSKAFDRRIKEFASAPDRFDASVSLRIAGGVASEYYEFELEVDSHGRVRCGMRCEMSHRRADLEELQVDPSEFAKLVRKLDPGAIAAASDRQGGFPPDSLIGRLEIRVEEERSVTYFMADSEQAKTACCEPSKAITQGVDVMYGFAESTRGETNLRP